MIVDSAGEGITTCVPIDSPVGTQHRIGLSQSDPVDRIDPKADVVGFTNMFLHKWPNCTASSKQPEIGSLTKSLSSEARMRPHTGRRSSTYLNQMVRTKHHSTRPRS